MACCLSSTKGGGTSALSSLQALPLRLIFVAAAVLEDEDESLVLRPRRAVEGAILAAACAFTSNNTDSDALTMEVTQLKALMN